MQSRKQIKALEKESFLGDKFEIIILGRQCYRQEFICFIVALKLVGPFFRQIQEERQEMNLYLQPRKWVSSRDAGLDENT